MPELEELLSLSIIEAVIAMFPTVVSRLTDEFPVEIGGAIPSPEEKQLATELAYLLSNMEPPPLSVASGVFQSILGRLVLYSQTKPVMRENEWKVLAQDAIPFHESLFAQAASMAALSMYLLLGGYADTSKAFATAVCGLAERVMPKAKFDGIIQYGWGEQHFLTPLPRWVQYLLEEKTKA